MNEEVEEGKSHQEIQSFWRSTNSKEEDNWHVNATYQKQLKEDRT
jgi:hypothetical protein